MGSLAKTGDRYKEVDPFIPVFKFVLTRLTDTEIAEFCKSLNKSMARSAEILSKKTKTEEAKRLYDCFLQFLGFLFSINPNLKQSILSHQFKFASKSTYFFKSIFQRESQRIIIITRIKTSIC